MSGLQVRVGLEVFLAKPDAGPLDFRDCAQVIDPFTITTSVDHCVEPATLSSYRCLSDLAFATPNMQPSAGPQYITYFSLLC